MAGCLGGLADVGSPRLIWMTRKCRSYLHFGVVPTCRDERRASATPPSNLFICNSLCPHHQVSDLVGSEVGPILGEARKRNTYSKRTVAAAAAPAWKDPTEAAAELAAGRRGRVAVAGRSDDGGGVRRQEGSRGISVSSSRGREARQGGKGRGGSRGGSAASSRSRCRSGSRRRGDPSSSEEEEEEGVDGDGSGGDGWAVKGTKASRKQAVKKKRDRRAHHAPQSGAAAAAAAPQRLSEKGRDGGAAAAVAGGLTLPHQQPPQGGRAATVAAAAPKTAAPGSSVAAAVQRSAVQVGPEDANGSDTADLNNGSSDEHSDKLSDDDVSGGDDTASDGAATGSVADEDELREREEAEMLEWCRAEEEREEREGRVKQLVVTGRGGDKGRQQQQRGGRGGGGGRGGAKKGQGPVVVCMVGEPNVSVGNGVEASAEWTEEGARENIGIRLCVCGAICLGGVLA